MSWFYPAQLRIHLQPPLLPTPSARPTLSHIPLAAPFWAAQVVCTPGVQHHTHLYGCSIAICQQQLPSQGARCPMTVLARTVQCGAGGWLLCGISHQPQRPPFWFHYPDSLIPVLLVGFYPFFASAKVGAARQAWWRGECVAAGATDQCKPLSLCYMLLPKGLLGY